MVREEEESILQELEKSFTEFEKKVFKLKFEGYSFEEIANTLSKDVKSILEIDREASVGVITFYSSQATKIKQKLELVLNGEEISHVEVGTVDAFQGKEFDYVLLSCVRSNIPKKEGDLPDVGFLVKPNRLCVAFSRAIKQLIIHGDANTLYQIPCFAKLFDICSNEGGCYRAY